MLKTPYIPTALLKYALRRHRYKLLCLGGTILMAPILPVGVHTLYSVYKFSYRSYYLYALLAAIQSSTCSWVSTPQVMCLNAAINYLFDSETANEIIKGIYWFSCKVVQSAHILGSFILERLGGVEGIRRFFSDTLMGMLYPPSHVEADFEVTFGKTDFDFVDIYVEPKKAAGNPQGSYDFCNKPAVFSSDNPQADEINQTPPVDICVKEQYIASM